MLNKIRDYLDFSGLQYRSPDKAGAEREKMLAFRHKGQEARKAFTELAKVFQANHPEWQLQQTSQWMNQAQRLRPHFWVYLQREGKVTEPMIALRLYGNPSLREKVRSQEVRKVLVKVDVPMTENSSEEEIVEGLLKSYSKILPYYLATRK